jgi:adenylate kinase
MVYAIVLFGCPGSGKSTLAEALIKKYNIDYIGSGDIVRTILKMENKVKDGNLLDDDIIIPVVLDKIGNQIKSNKNFILDGFPRNMLQSIKLGDYFRENNVKSIQIYLDLPQEIAMLRLRGRGRNDDEQLSAIENRLTIYVTQTYPAMKYFQLQNHKIAIYTINGNQDKENIRKQVLDHYQSTIVGRMDSPFSDPDFYEPFKHDTE